MKKMKKLLVSLGLVAALVSSTLPVEAFAAEETMISTETAEEMSEISSTAVLEERESSNAEESTEMESATATEKTTEEGTAETETTSVEEETSEEVTEAGTEDAEVETEGTETDVETEEFESLDMQETVEEDDNSTASKHPTVATVDRSGDFDLTAEEVPFSNKKVLLIQDSIPWSDGRNDIDSNQVVLSQLAPYDVTSTKKFPSMDVSDYAVIIFANDQAIETYTNYARFQDKMEEYAEQGGVIVFGAADGGWANGELSAALIMLQAGQCGISFSHRKQILQRMLLVHW